MATIGIICEYNPFHLGHASQITRIRSYFGPDAVIVCLMSGRFVQRGEPAIFDRTNRAKAAMLCGADLVLELPVTASLSSAEGFAQKGVAILSGICDYLCFGTETANAGILQSTAQALLDPAFSPALKAAMKGGISFPAAREKALRDIGASAGPLRLPNDILAVEYTKAILQQGSPMKIFPIQRPGNYHAETPDPQNPSATALRRLILNGQDFTSYVPEETHFCFENAPIHNLKYGERAILYRLRTMYDEEFAALPYGSEGLWRRFMHACREERNLESILKTVKTKRYTRTRLNRMLMCAFLGINQDTLTATAPYCRILGFDSQGRSVLNGCKKNDLFQPLGRKSDSAYAELEDRCNGLYDLFSQDSLPQPREHQKQRVYTLSR